MSPKSSTFRKWLRAILFSLLTAGLFIFICWMGGYNFDHRNESVGVMTFFIVISTLAAGIIAYHFDDLKAAGNIPTNSP